MATAALALPVVAVVGVTLVAFLGRRSWAFELLANLRLHLTVAALLVTVVVAAFRRWRLLAAAGVALLLNLAVTAPVLIPWPPAPPASDATELRVTFFNTKNAAADQAEVIEHLRAGDDDVVVLAATNPGWVRRLQEAGLDLTIVGGNHLDPGLELLTLVRDPSNVEVTVHRPTERNRDALVEVTVTQAEGPVHVLATHAISPLTRERAAARDAQLAWIAHWARQQHDPVIVMGDLNVTPWSPRFGDLLTNGDLRDPLRRHGPQPTWPAEFGLLGIPIDHILHGPELTTIERTRGPSFDSDHRLVTATIARREDAR